MFDISLGELSVIGAVALVVLGPEKLPKVARAAGLMLGRAQRMAADFRSDLERDLHNSELADLGKQMAEEEAKVRGELTAVTAEVSQALSELEGSHLHDYGEGDPELDALEHRRYGGSDEDLAYLHHEESDPELEALDLQRYGGASQEEQEDSTESQVAVVALADHEVLIPPVVQATQADPVGHADKPEAPMPAQVPLVQPDLFAQTASVSPENVWRDRR